MGEAAFEAHAERPRIVVLMDNRNNSALIDDELAGENDVRLDIPAAPEDFAQVDLIVVDGVSLHRYGRMLADARALQRPLQLPVLLLTDRDEPRFLAPALESVVDDMIRRPSTKGEFCMRVRALLRSRSLSLELRRMNELYETERDVAQRFQQAALPKALPQVAGIALSAYYRAGHRDVLVGGDWYDALELDDGRLVLSVGDVCGSGLDAAVLMAHVRQVIRGVAHVHPDPQMMLDAVNRNLHAEYPSRMVTALAAVLDPVASTLHYANAGHEPPLLRAASGAVETFETGDLPLGVLGDPPQLRVAHVPPGSALVMYTDGLTEFNREPLRNQERLQAALASGAVLTDPDPARALFYDIIRGDPPDDVAIFVLKRDAQDPTLKRWRFESSDPHAFAQTREAIHAELQELRFGSAAAMTAETIFAELIGNVVRYAPGIAEVVLDIRSARPTIHVLDCGPSFTYAPRLPTNLLSESGRGLFLVKQLSREFNVSPRPEGGSHARVVLLSDAL